MLGEISGGTPVPTMTQADLVFCGRPDLARPPTVTPPPKSDLVFPVDQAPNSHYPYSLPGKLIDFFAAQPGAIEMFGTEDLHGCTQSHPGFAFFTQTQEVAVAKTSVLVLTTQTGAPIMRTADTPKEGIAPTPTPADTPPPPAGHVEDTSTQPLIAPIADKGGVITSSQAKQNGDGMVSAIVNAILGSAAPPGPSAGTNPTPSPAGDSAESIMESKSSNDPLVVGNSITAGLSGTPVTFAAPAVLDIGGALATPDAAGNPVLGATTLSAGSPALTVASTTISLSVNSAGSTLTVVNGSPTPLPALPRPVITIGEQVFTADTAGGFVAGSSTLSISGPALTIGGTTISVATNNVGSTVAVINGITSNLNAFPSTAVMTVEGRTFTPFTSGSSTFFVVDGVTVSPGQTTTIRGSTITAPTGLPSQTFPSRATTNSEDQNSAVPTSTPAIQESEGDATGLTTSGWAGGLFLCILISLFQ